ncbi:MAG: hypothetical protein ACJ8C4_09895 [Gemmataceae bacterium]
MPSDVSVQWLSPLRADDYAEYQDDSFLERLGIVLSTRSLNGFWPHRGPVWDGLGKSCRGDIFLIEAKSHIAEMRGKCRAGEESRGLIDSGLAETKGALAEGSQIDWAGTYYQYTNRLAHLYLLRHLNQIPAYLVFAYFINDAEMNGPTSQAKWLAAIQRLRTSLGLTHTPLSPFIADVFFDVNDLDSAGDPDVQGLAS